MTFTGLFVPLITPFTDADDLALDALEQLASDVLDSGAKGIVALGTTGEPATLTDDERRQVVDVCARVCAEREAALIVGTGSNSTAASVGMVTALDSRVSAALAVVPYYTRPTQEGIVEHFRRLAVASPVPLIIYNVPYRTSTPLTLETLTRLAQIPNVAGFKHSVGAIDEITAAFISSMPVDFSLLAGDDLFVGPLVGLGAAGAIAASANIATSSYVNLIDAWQNGPVGQARALNSKLVPLARALFAEPNPVVIKAVLAAQGRIPSPNVRLPLLNASPAVVQAALELVPG